MVVLKYGWWIWGLSLPTFLVTYVYSFFLASKIAYESQADCRQKFIFTPKDVEYCSDIYPIDVFLISLKTYPLSYLCIASGMFFVLYPLYQLYKKNLSYKTVYLALSWIPVPFLFHFFEYNQYISMRSSASPAIVLCVAIIIVGGLSTQANWKTFFLMNGIAAVLTLCLASLAIPNDLHWFKPVTRNVAMVFTAIVYTLGQLVVHFLVRSVITLVKR
jgi:hypothetical protein